MTSLNPMITEIFPKSLNNLAIEGTVVSPREYTPTKLVYMHDCR